MKRFLNISFLFIFLFISTTQAQWQFVNSPLATPDIRFVAHHPDGLIFAISNENEVFRSSINHNEWNKIATLDSQVMCLAISPDGIIYTGIKGGYMFSTDLGINWQQKNLLSNYLYGYVSDIEFNSLGHIFMIPHSDYSSDSIGVWVSIDDGINWSKRNIGLTNVYYGLVGIAIDSFDNLYVLTEHGYVYASTNNGNNWEMKTHIPCIATKIEIDSDNNLYFSFSWGIYKSTDLGNNWIQCSNISISVINLSIDENNNVYAILGWGEGINFSSDGGSNWVNIGLIGLNTWDLISFDNVIYTGTNRGLQKSTISGSWACCFQYDNRYVSVYDMLILDDGKIFAGTNEGLFLSNDNFSSWDSTAIFKSTSFINKDNLDNIFAVADYLYRSTDKGISWSQCGNNTPPYITSLFINDLNHIFIFSDAWGGLALLVSKDGGLTFQYLYLIMDSNRYTSFSVTENSSRSVFMSYLDGYLWWKVIQKKDVNGNWTIIATGIVALDMYFYDDVMYLATQSEGIFKSYDNGSNLIPINNGLTNLEVAQLILKPEVFLALTGDAIYRSLDQGNYWTRLDHTDLNSTINRIYYDDNKNLYACTQNGLYLFSGLLPVELLNFTSTLYGEIITLNWSTATELNNQGFEIQRKTENSDWATVGFKEGNGTTSNQSEYSFVDDISYVKDREIKYRLKQVDFNGSFTYSKEIKVFLNPIEFSLSQNYPNPFNPTTKISYQLPKESKVVLRVYDILGSEVATIINEYQEAGYKELDFDASSVSSGIYIYKISAGDFVSSKKMIVAK